MFSPTEFPWAWVGCLTLEGRQAGNGSATDWLEPFLRCPHLLFRWVFKNGILVHATLPSPCTTHNFLNKNKDIIKCIASSGARELRTCDPQSRALCNAHGNARLFTRTSSGQNLRRFVFERLHHGKHCGGGGDSYRKGGGGGGGRKDASKGAAGIILLSTIKSSGREAPKRGAPPPPFGCPEAETTGEAAPSAWAGKPEEIYPPLAEGDG